MAALIATLLAPMFLFVVFAQADAAGQRKPIHTDVINVHVKAPPDSLAEMILSADLVVRGRVLRTSRRDAHRTGNPFDSPMTAFQFEVLEIIDAGSGPAASTTIEILRHGGDRDVGTHIERSYEGGFPPFDRGHEYLLFLAWNAALDAWVPAYGPDSAFDLTGGVVIQKGPTIMRLSTSRWVVAVALGGGLDQCVLNGGYQYSFRVGILRGRRRGGLSLKQNDGQRHDERHGRNNAA